MSKHQHNPNPNHKPKQKKKEEKEKEAACQERLRKTNKVAGFERNGAPPIGGCSLKEAEEKAGIRELFVGGMMRRWWKWLKKEFHLWNHLFLGLHFSFPFTKLEWFGSVRQHISQQSKTVQNEEFRN